MRACGCAGASIVNDSKRRASSVKGREFTPYAGDVVGLGNRMQSALVTQDLAAENSADSRALPTPPPPALQIAYN